MPTCRCSCGILVWSWISIDGTGSLNDALYGQIDALMFNSQGAGPGVAYLWSVEPCTQTNPSVPYTATGLELEFDAAGKISAPNTGNSTDCM